MLTKFYNFFFFFFLKNKPYILLHIKIKFRFDFTTVKSIHYLQMRGNGGREVIYNLFPATSNESISHAQHFLTPRSPLGFYGSSITEAPILNLDLNKFLINRYSFHFFPLDEHNVFYTSSFFNHYYGVNSSVRGMRFKLISSYFLKRNLNNVLNVITYLGFCSAKPFFVYKGNLSDEVNNFERYFRDSSFIFADFVVVLDIDLMYKLLSSVKKLDIPIISIVDKNYNIELIDYPIIVSSVTSTACFFFFLLFTNFFLYGTDRKSVV